MYGMLELFLEYFGIIIIGDLLGLEDFKVVGFLEVWLLFDFVVLNLELVGKVVEEELDLIEEGEEGVF